MQLRPLNIQRWAGMIGALAFSILSSKAGIVYLPETNRLVVADYPESAPCTPVLLRSADRAHGWGKVTYNPATDTTTVAADLVIGKNDLTDTFFQIGSPEHPREIVQVLGQVWVQADWVSEKESDRWWTAPERHVNRLTLGRPDHTNIVAALKLGPKKSLWVGSPGDGRHGGQLYVYNSVLTAVTPNASNMADSILLIGNSIVLQDAVVSWFAGDMSSGVGPRWRGTGIVDNVIFEHGGIGLKNGAPIVTRSTFRDLKIAVIDYGSMNATLTDCVFTNNNCNWSLCYSDKGLTCIDCRWWAPTKGDEFRSWENPRTKKKQYPMFTSRRHLIVAVADETNAPVAKAQVEVACEQSPEAWLIDNRRAVTDARGRTPGPDQPAAILVTEQFIRATDVPNQPATSNFTYRLQVSAPGYQPAAVAGIKPTPSWQVIPVVLKK